MHKIKVTPSDFEKISRREKVAEIHSKDIGYKKNAWLVLEEWDGGYTGRYAVRQIVLVERLDNIGLSGWVLVHMR